MIPMYKETKTDDEARVFIEYNMGLASGAYSKKILGFRPSFGTVPKKGEWDDPTGGKKELTSGGPSSKFHSLANASRHSEAKEHVLKLKQQKALEKKLIETQK